MKYLIIAILIPITIDLSAQIHRQYIDQNNHNETIIVKHQAASDAAILNELDDYGLGMGDVIRISTEDVQTLTTKEKVKAPLDINRENVTTALLVKNEIRSKPSSRIEHTAETSTLDRLNDTKHIDLHTIPTENDSHLSTNVTIVSTPAVHRNVKNVKQNAQQNIGWQPSYDYLAKRSKQLAARRQSLAANIAASEQNTLLVQKENASTKYPQGHIQQKNVDKNAVVSHKRKLKKRFKKRLRKRKPQQGKKWSCFKF